MINVAHNLTARQKRKHRSRGKVKGTANRPRVSVFRSNQHTLVQVIDDQQGHTLAAAGDLGKEKKYTGTKTERAQALAQDLAAQLKKKKINQVVYDRGAYRYHGRVKAIAEVLRAAGLEF